MKIEELRTKKVAILGLGVEGLATAQYFLEHEIAFTVIDEKSLEALEQVGEAWEKMLQKLQQYTIPLLLGKPFTIDVFSQFDVLVRSPGLSPLKESFIQAKEKGITITSATKLFFDNCPAKIIGVTGTKGKGTTATLIYEMLKEAGFDAYLGGNIGVPQLSFLDTLIPQSVVVLEMSSFQLIDLEKSPTISVMLMVTSEHLDYHATTEEYVESKRNILKWQTVDDMAILNVDYPSTIGSKTLTKGKVVFVSRYSPVGEGCFVRDNEVILRLSKGTANSGVLPLVHPVSAPSAGSVRPGEIPSFASPQEGIEEYRVIDVNDILLPGAHNHENVCAAVMAAFAAGVGVEDICSVLRTFKGLEHRLELVRELGGVRYYDDSFSTVPETAIAAIEAFKEPEILILGGSSKNSDFSQLGQVISQATNIKAIIGIGVEWERIKYQIPNTQYQIQFVEGLKTMGEIVKVAAEIAESGDVVLLSPACASFDMFKNYKDRGNQFKEHVNLL